MNEPTLASLEQLLKEKLSSPDGTPKVTAALLESLSPLLSSATVKALAREILADDTLLKAVADRSYTHSLGFRKITLFNAGFTLRLHIWDPEAAAQAVPLKEAKHEHSFDFISRILYGGMETHCFLMRPLSQGEEALLKSANERLAVLGRSDKELVETLLNALETEESIALGSKQASSPLAQTAQERLQELLRITGPRVTQLVRFQTRLQYDSAASVFGGNYVHKRMGNTKLISHSVTSLEAGDLYFHGHELAHRLYMPANQPNATLVVTSQVSDEALGSSLQNALSVHSEKSEFARRMYSAEEMRQVLKNLLKRLEVSADKGPSQSLAHAPENGRLIDLAAGQRPLNVGLIGPGSVADQWLIPGLGKVAGARLWSVLGRDQGKTASFSLKHQAAAPQPNHTGLDSFLNDPLIDAVIIASPDNLHVEHALACARAGKHILLEKPMATSVRDAKRIEAACLKYDVLLMIGYHLRFHEGHRKLAQLIASGKLGEPLSMRLTWTMQAPPGDWRKDDRTLGKWWSLAALGTHGIDLACHLLTPVCGKVTGISSKLAMEASGEGGGQGEPQAQPQAKRLSDKTSVVRIRFKNGAQAEIISSFAFKAPRSIEIIGDRGRALCLDTLGARGGGTITVNDQELPFAQVDPYQAELSHFLAGIRGHRSKLVPPACDAACGRENIAYIEMATTRTHK